MNRTPTRRLVSVATLLCLVGAVVASACPTCETEGHAPLASPAGCCDTEPLVDDWQASAAGCACCGPENCSDGAELPDGLLGRPAPLPPAVLAMSPRSPALSAFPPANGPAADAADPHPPSKIHIQHQTLLC